MRFIYGNKDLFTQTATPPPPQDFLYEINTSNLVNTLQISSIVTLLISENERISYLLQKVIKSKLCNLGLNPCTFHDIIEMLSKYCTKLLGRPGHQLLSFVRLEVISRCVLELPPPPASF